MGVPWGILEAGAEHEPVGKIIARWYRVAEADVCSGFTIPVGGTFYTLTRTSEGKVRVSNAARPEVLAEIRALNCPDGTYDRFERLFDGYSYFFPDGRGFRRLPVELFGNGCTAESLVVLTSLKGAGLAKELRAAGRLAKKHGLVVSISFG